MKPKEIILVILAVGLLVIYFAAPSTVTLGEARIHFSFPPGAGWVPVGAVALVAIAVWQGRKRRAQPEAPVAAPSRWRQICALALGIGNAGLAALWFAVLFLTDAREGGELVFAAIFLTAPPVIFFTGAALFLVGPKRCKLAWISALVYASPFWVGMIGSVFHAASP